MIARSFSMLAVVRTAGALSRLGADVSAEALAVNNGTDRGGRDFASAEERTLGDFAPAEFTSLSPLLFLLLGESAPCLLLGEPAVAGVLVVEVGDSGCGCGFFAFILGDGVATVPGAVSFSSL
jgi:hypothetical protein